MYRPVLVTAADPLSIVTVEQAIRQCRITIDDGDTVALAEVTELLSGYIGSAIGHLDGWTGILGACLGEQTWRQDFDAFSSCLPLPLGPVLSIESVAWRNEAGQIATIGDSNYALRTDGSGRSFCRFLSSYSFPTGLYESGAVSITYKAGYAAVPGVPLPIRQAILLMVGAWHENREEAVLGVSSSGLTQSVAVDRLLAPWRKIEI